MFLIPRSGAAALLAAVVCAPSAAQQFQLQQPPLGISGLPVTGLAIGTGMCVADFDGDGDVDVVLAQAPGLPYLYYRNDGGMQFVDETANWQLGLCGATRCMTAADIDNDGDPDLVIANDNTLLQLFVNQGGYFTAESLARGITCDDHVFGATFGDFDRDGWLDLYLGVRYPGSVTGSSANVLYRNVGGGYFVDVTATAGVGSLRPALVVAFMDYDEDGWPDLLIANDKGLQFGPNELYRNNGNGTFTDVSVQTGTNIAVDGMAIDYCDVFNDGGVDFYVSDLPPDHLFQVWDPVAGAYTDETYTYGLTGGAIGWASNFFDYDNDGWQDLHVVQLGAPNMLYQNPCAPAAALQPWPNQSVALGIGHFWYQYVAATADFDDDGRVDLLERFAIGPPGTMAPDGVMLFRNEVVGGNWLKFRTRGTASNRDGYGARFELRCGNLVQRQAVRSGVGYQTCSDRRLHFGLGGASQADLVTVRWPSGQIQYLTDVQANQIVDVVEPQLTLSAPAQVGTTTSLELSIPGDEGLTWLMALSFSSSPHTTMPDGKVLPLAIDGLTALTLSPGNPLLPAPIGVLDATGAASTQLHVPPIAGLVGLTFYATACTIDTQHFQLLRTVFPRALEIPIQ